MRSFRGRGDCVFAIFSSSIELPLLTCFLDLEMMWQVFGLLGIENLLDAFSTCTPSRIWDVVALNAECSVGFGLHRIEIMYAAVVPCPELGIANISDLELLFESLEVWQIL